MDHNGISWPALCVNKTEAHFFGIGDWGGDQNGGHTWENSGVFARRARVSGPDDYGQLYVARQMVQVAATADPDFVLNAGDNFYPGGYNAACGPGSATAPDDATGQFGSHETLYKGPGLDGKPWISVLGNHDYGGISYEQGWDAQIFHTWSSDTWRMPGQYWTQPVRYNGFSIDIFMLESNFLDAKPPGSDPDHNICHDIQGTDLDCWGLSLNTCTSWFHDSWQHSIDMLQEGMSKSTADWKFVVTHYPGPVVASLQEIQDINTQYGIDMLFTGHSHSQLVGDTSNISWVQSGGGGGVSSDALPTMSGHDCAYGFVDFEINKDTLKIHMNSWGGGDGTGPPIVMQTKTISKTSVGNTRETVFV